MYEGKIIMTLCLLSLNQKNTTILFFNFCIVDMQPNLYDYLKIAALCSMILDHIGYYLYPDNQRWRVYGRFAFPIFLFLVGYNISYRWRRNLVGFAIAIQVIIWSAYMYGYAIADPMLNILGVIVLVRLAMAYIIKQPLSLQR